MTRAALLHLAALHASRGEWILAASLRAEVLGEPTSKSVFAAPKLGSQTVLDNADSGRLAMFQVVGRLSPANGHLVGSPNASLPHSEPST
jgi:hypothetical protein